jgi:hypothetical protein
MLESFDEFSKNLAIAASRRDALKIGWRGTVAVFFSCVGAGRLWGDPTSCPKGQVLMSCAGRHWCVAPGSVCCGNSPCEPPYTICKFCRPGQWTCLKSGQTCNG